MSTLRIGVDARPLLHPYSGIGRYTKELLRCMAGQSAHHWFLYSTAPIPAEHLSTNVTSRCVRGPGSSLLSTLASQILFPSWAAQDQLSLFWAPRHHLPIRHLPIPTLVTIHDMVWKTMPESMPWSKAQLERWLMPRSLALATAIVTVSESTKQDLVSTFPDTEPKITKILEASSLQELQVQQDSTRSSYALCVGTFEPRKNVERCIAGYALAFAKDPSIPKLIFAGNEGWNRRPIGELIRMHGMEQQIEVIIGSTDQDLASLYANCRFLLHPALYEGFALPIVEAMAFGKPIITSNRSSMPEVAGSAALLINPLDSHDIGNAINQLCSDVTLEQRLSNAASAEAKRFSWDIAAQQTLSLIEQVGSSAIPD